MRPVPLLLLLPTCAVVAQTPPPLVGEAHRRATEAYRCQGAGDLPGALAAVDAALALAPRHPQLLRLQVDLLVAAGQPERAEAPLQVLLDQRPGDPDLRLLRVGLLQRRGRLGDAAEEAAGILATPGLGAAHQQRARLTLADLEQAQGRPALALEALAPLDRDPVLEVQSRRAFLLLASGRSEAACQAFEEALQLEPAPGHRAVLLRGLGDASRAALRPDLELRALEQLQAQDPGDRRAALELAYAYLARQRDADALAQFATALDEQSRPEAWLDAGYTAKRLGQNTLAAGLLSRGLALRKAAGLVDPEKDHRLRREVEQLERTWTFLATTAFRQGALLPGASAQEHLVQQGLEAAFQPRGWARDGRGAQLFAQAFENLRTGDGGATGGPSFQGVLGLRLKPFSTQNLVLSAQRLFRGGRTALDDWMFRAAWSLSEGLDLQPWQGHWPAWSLYAEGATFARTGHAVFQAEARVGHAWRPEALGGGTVVTPHAVLAVDFDNQMLPRPAGGLGLGTSLRRWIGGTPRTAPAAWMELTLQARARISAAPRGGGLFATLSMSF